MFPVRLVTPRLVLREIRDEDWRDARALDGDPQVVRYLTHDVLDEEGSRAQLARNVEAARASPRLVFDLAITLPGDERFLGRVGMHVVRPEHREGMLWFTLRRDHWGRGLAPEAARAMVDFAFGTLKLHRVFGDCDPRNVSSARVMEKLGMRREAHFRENWWLKGEWCGAYIYAVLEHEWAAARP